MTEEAPGVILAINAGSSSVKFQVVISASRGILPANLVVVVLLHNSTLPPNHRTGHHQDRH